MAWQKVQHLMVSGGQETDASTRSRTAAWALYLALTVALYFYVSLFRNVLVDDAFITLRYVRTLHASGTWGFFPGYTANTATSPLNVLLLTLMSLITGSDLGAVVWITVVELLILAQFLRGIGNRLGLPLFGWLAFVSLVVNPWLISTLGLESFLLVTLMTGALYFLVAGRLDAMAFACGLLAITRADGILLPAVAVIFVSPSRRLRFLSLLLATIAPWYLFSWIHLGSLVPDSLMLKANDPWDGFTFVNGLQLYVRTYPLQTFLTFVGLPVAVLAWSKRVRALGSIVAIVAAYAALHFVAYSLLRAGPSHWYYVPEIAGVVLLGTLVVSVWCRDLRGRHRTLSRLVAGVAFGLPVAGMLALFGIYRLPLDEMFVHTNWSTPAQYRAVGEWLKAHHGGEVGSASTEIGTLVYYCDCFLINQFGDRGWLNDKVARYKDSGDLRSSLAQLNFLFYTPQPQFPAETYWLTVRRSADKGVPEVPPWEISSRWRTPQWLTWTPQAP